MGSGTAEAGDVVGAVNGKAVIEENRMRHRRVVIFAREMHPLHRLRMEHTARRAVAATAGGDRQVVARRTMERRAVGDQAIAMGALSGLACFMLSSGR